MPHPQFQIIELERKLKSFRDEACRDIAKIQERLLKLEQRKTRGKKHEHKPDSDGERHTRAQGASEDAGGRIAEGESRLVPGGALQNYCEEIGNTAKANGQA